MNSNLIKQLSSLVSKMPKKDLAKGLERAKGVLNSSKKEDLEKLLESEEISKLLGKDSEKIKQVLKETDLSKIDVSSLSETVNKIKSQEGE